MRGRPPKPIGLHTEDGTYREDRHGGRVNADGSPLKPDLPEEAATLWDWLSGILDRMGVLSEADELSMERLCRMWPQWRKCMEAVEADPLDRDARLNETAFGREVDGLLQQFGLTPAARSRIHKQPEVKKGVARRKKRA